MIKSMFIRVTIFILFLVVAPRLTQAREPIEIGLAAIAVDGKIPQQKIIRDFQEQLGRPLSTFNFFLDLMVIQVSYFHFR